MTLHTNYAFEVRIDDVYHGRGVPWLWVCQQRGRWIVRRTVTASAMPWTAWSSTPKLLYMILEDNLKAV